MRKIRLPYKFTPRIYQLPFLKAMEAKRRACLIWHRRSGKEKTCLNFMINEMIKRVGTYCYFFPTLKQGRKVLWMGMDYTGFKFMDHFPPELVKRTREDEMMKELHNGSVFYIAGSDNFDAVMGTNPVGLVFSEYALQDPRAYDFFRPIVRENKGWTVFNFTPRGKNHGWELYEKVRTLDSWFAQILTIDNTERPDGSPVISKEDIDQDRLEGMEEDLIQQEYYCSFEGGLAGQIYGRLMLDARKDGRITQVPHIPDIPVYTFWDIGVRDDTCVWFLQFPNDYQINAIRYFSHRGEGVGYYVQQLEDLRLSEKYIYGGHYAPHDMGQKQFGTGKSPQEIANDLNCQFELIERTRSLQHGINMVRTVIPKIHFDEKNCQQGIRCLQSYHREWDAKYKRYTDQPVHDWSSHGSDALRTFGEGVGRVTGKKMTKEEVDRLESKYIRGISEENDPLDLLYDDFFYDDVGF